MKVGFIGCGNMASAIIGGILRDGLVPANEIIASALHEETLARASAAFGIQTTLYNRNAAMADIIFLAVKPQFYDEVIHEIRDCVTEHQLVVSIAPGKSIAAVTESFGREIKLIRAMPNTPAMIGAGVTAVCSSSNVTEKEQGAVLRLLQACGTTEVAVSGSSPAYVFMMIEAMADGAVRDGIPRTQAYRLAAQAVLGSAKMVLETGKHPGELKDMVCSPAGTTIEAVAALEASGFRSAILDGMKACSDRTAAMSRPQPQR